MPASAAVQRAVGLTEMDPLGGRAQPFQSAWRRSEPRQAAGDAIARPMGAAENQVKEELESKFVRALAGKMACGVLRDDPCTSATAADDEDGLLGQLQRTRKKRQSVEVEDTVEELNDLVDRGVISGGQLAELAQRSELIAPTLACCSKQRKALATEAKARRQQEEAAAVAAVTSPRTRATICLQRHLRGWKAREHFAWLLREQGRVRREEARRLARKKKKELEARVRAQLADLQVRWLETHASLDLDAVAATVAQAAMLNLRTAEVARLLAAEKARREEEAEAAAAARADEEARAAIVLQAHSRRRKAQARTRQVQSARVIQAYAQQRIVHHTVIRVRAALPLQAHARRRLSLLRAHALRRVRVEARLLAQAKADDVVSEAAQREMDAADKAARERLRRAKEGLDAAAAAQREMERAEDEKEAMRQRLERERVEAAARAKARREAAEREQREMEVRLEADRQQRARRVADAKAKREAEERAKRLELGRREAEEAERRRVAEQAEAAAREADEQGLAVARRSAARRAIETKARRAAGAPVGGDADATASQRGEWEASAGAGEAPREERPTGIMSEHEAQIEAKAHAYAVLSLARGMDAARRAIEARLAGAAAAEDQFDALRGAAGAATSREAELAALRRASLLGAAAQLRHAGEVEMARAETEQKERHERLEAMRRQFNLIAGSTAHPPPLRAPQFTVGPRANEVDGLGAGAIDGEAAGRSPMDTAALKLDAAAAAARSARDQQMRQLHERAKADMAAAAAHGPEGDPPVAGRLAGPGSSGASASSTPKARLADARGRDGRINSAAWSSLSARAGGDQAAELPAKGMTAASSSFQLLQQKLRDMDQAVEARKRGSNVSVALGDVRVAGGTGQAGQSPPSSRLAGSLQWHGTKSFRDARGVS